jgi:hypothetical protein
MHFGRTPLHLGAPKAISSSTLSMARYLFGHRGDGLAATWLMQGGTDRWQAAGFLGKTIEQLEAGYGHEHPDFQEAAARGCSPNSTQP